MILILNKKKTWLIEGDGSNSSIKQEILDRCVAFKSNLKKFVDFGLKRVSVRLVNSTITNSFIFRHSVCLKLLHRMNKCK